MSSDPGPGGPPRALWTGDLGNSALKLALWSDPGQGAGPRLLARATLARDGDLIPRFEAWLRQCVAEQDVRPERLRGGLSSVASDAESARLGAAARGVLGEGCFVDVGHGVENTCEQPHTVGQDRLFAARGAAELVGGSAVVIDVGTAMTVDAVRWTRPGGGRPEFLGGAIAPGPALLARSLSLAARLHEVQLDPRAPALGRHTTQALRAGVLHGLRGAAEELSRRVGAEAGLAAAPRVLTGGARELLLEPWPFWSGALVVEPDLVHLGLLAGLRDSAGRVESAPRSLETGP